MQTLVGTGSVAEERRPADGPIYEAGSRPEKRDARITPDRLAAASTALVVLSATALVIWQFHPMTLLFTNTMDVGGDNAGHVAAPYYLIHNLLTHGQVSGWDPQWFDGFPLYVFYFPLPALLVAIFNLVMPYAVAFKLVTVAGSVLMPGAAYLFGRLAGFRRPAPALMAAAMLPFLYNTSYTIDGGNIASTMAGEFSFSLSMTFGLVFLGVVVRGLDTGRYRTWAAILFACTILCHVVPALFFAFAALAFTLAKGDWRRFKFLIPAGVTGALLAGFWLIPFGAYLQYSSSMGYGRVTDFVNELFPVGYLWVGALALLGFLIATIGHLLVTKKIDRSPAVLGVLVGAAAAGFALLPSGQVYNARWLPFWFLMLALLAGYAVAEVVHTAGTLLEFERWHETVGALIGGFAALIVVAVPLGLLQVFGYSTPATSFIPGWITWNYTGYQAKPGWPAYQGILTLLEKQTAVHGCGRVEYEYTGNDVLTNQFGSPMAFMSLGMWTGGCVDTTEGLYFESSTTTPFHFLDQTEFSQTPSQPVVGIPYASYNVADGIRHSQLMGVNYLLAGSATTEMWADKDPSLEYLGSTPGVPSISTVGGKTVSVPTSWKLYYVKGSPLVSALDYEPVVETMGKQQWLDLGTRWYQSESYWPVPVILGGPASWPHAKAGTLVAAKQAVPIQRTSVSNVTVGNESVSFDVSKTGVPVMVKVPYFPNWHASGAEGPWAATPNLMVVLPTSHHVTLTYGTSNADWAGYAATAVGLGLLVTFCVVPPVKFEPTRRPDEETGLGEADGPPDPDGRAGSGGGDGPAEPAEPADFLDDLAPEDPDAGAGDVDADVLVGTGVGAGAQHAGAGDADAEVLVGPGLRACAQHAGTPLGKVAGDAVDDTASEPLPLGPVPDVHRELN